jgi:hypothetical protein
MRFLLGFLCMTAIVILATALIVIELLIKLLPLMITALVVLVAMQKWNRRRTLSAADSTVLNVPDESAFVAPERPLPATIRCRRATGPADTTARPAGIPNVGMGSCGLAPASQVGAALYPLQHRHSDPEIVDGEVIGEDGRRG